MSDEILELANKVKSRVDSNKASCSTCITNNELLIMCRYIERINNLEPVGYINPVATVLLKRERDAAIKPNKESNSIPLYRLDK